MSKFFKFEINTALKVVMAVLSCVGIVMGLHYTAKSTVLSAENSAKKIVVIEADVVYLKRCQGIQEEKNKKFEDAIIQSRDMFKEIREDLRNMRR